MPCARNVAPRRPGRKPPPAADRVGSAGHRLLQPDADIPPSAVQELPIRVVPTTFIAALDLTAIGYNHYASASHPGVVLSGMQPPILILESAGAVQAKRAGL